MKLRLNNLDPTIIENELGDPMFKRLSIHPSDSDMLLYFERVVDTLKKENRSLTNDVKELQSILEEIRDICTI